MFLIFMKIQRLMITISMKIQRLMITIFMKIQRLTNTHIHEHSEAFNSIYIFVNVKGNISLYRNANNVQHVLFP